MFMSMALASLASCYDMDDMSKNPYELPDNTTGGGEEQPGEEDKTKYADINIDLQGKQGRYLGAEERVELCQHRFPQLPL